ncbi:hypothetical protein QVD17_32306 [Tagetes erecta]|uniref:Uncharacterized protein n=1 Tax=Tagetes erecta TaxID=13708 RepID=A0AAD8KBI6_TARER|nr:hypothetical protein QVD17_32306 [Tagetes erecta]
MFEYSAGVGPVSKSVFTTGDCECDEEVMGLCIKVRRDESVKSTGISSDLKHELNDKEDDVKIADKNENENVISSVDNPLNGDKTLAFSGDYSGQRLLLLRWFQDC